MKFALKLFTLISLSFSTIAAKEILVGAYHFPPFYMKTNGVKSGVVIDIINELNSVQNKYKFRVVETSARRRYRDFISNRFDMIFFESPDWGWSEREIEYNMTPPFSMGGEKFIAKRAKNIGQEDLKKLKNKTILLYDGYHYGFLDFDIEKSFDAKLIYTNSHEGNILSILKGRGDIAVVTESYLTNFLERNKELKNKLIISEHYDQEYSHRVLMTKKASISKGTMVDLLKQIQEKPCCRKIFKF